MLLCPAAVATEVPDWRNALPIYRKVLEILPNSTILGGMLALGSKTAEG